MSRTRTRTRIAHRTRMGLALAALVIGFGVPRVAPAIDPVYSPFFGDAIRGTDPVAYFTEGRPVEGSRDHTLEYMGATWRFASAENKALFEGAPEKYAPQYGGYCAVGTRMGLKIDIQPDQFKIVDQKLYINSSENAHVPYGILRPGP